MGNEIRSHIDMAEKMTEKILARVEERNPIMNTMADLVNDNKPRTDNALVNG